MRFDFNAGLIKLKRFINLNDKRFLLVLSILVGIIAGFCVVHPGKLTIGIPAAMFFFALLLIIAPMFTNVEEEKKLFLNLAIGAFLIRTVVAFILVSVAMLVFRDPVGGHSFANDAYRYLNSSNRVIEFFEQGGSLFFLLRSKADWMSVSQISNSFPWVATFISLVFGAYRTLIAGSIYSAFMASLTVLMIYKIAKDLLPDDKKSMAVDAAILAMFFPSFIIFTSVMLKESSVIFLSYSLLYLFYRYCISKKPYFLVLLVIGLALLASLRVYGAAIVVFAMGIGYFSYIVRKQGAKDIVKSLLILAVVTILIFTVGRGIFKIDFLMSVLDVENIQDLRETHYGAGSTYFEIGDLTSPVGILKAIPVGFSYMLLSPFPWQWIGGTDMVEKALAPDMVLYYIILPSVILGFIRTIRRNPLLGSILITYFFAVALPYSIFIGNFGTIYRLRTQLLPFIFVMAVVGGTPFVRWIYYMATSIYKSVTKMQPEPIVLDR